MKGFYKKAKKTAKGVVDSLRPPSRQGRSLSPTPSQTPGQSTPNLGANPDVVPVTSSPNTAQPVSSSSSPLHVTPAYASPPPPPSALATTGSVIYELLMTIRDASDMFLPLKAAVVGVLKIWDVCEVRSLAAGAAHQGPHAPHSAPCNLIKNSSSTRRSSSDC